MKEPVVEKQSALFISRHQLKNGQGAEGYFIAITFFNIGWCSGKHACFWSRSQRFETFPDNGYMLTLA